MPVGERDSLLVATGARKTPQVGLLDEISDCPARRRRWGSSTRSATDGIRLIVGRRARATAKSGEAAHRYYDTG